MNKIYKVIWSKVKGCYVVVSELAKRHSKGKSLKSAASLVALTAILAFLPVQVNATDIATGDNIARVGRITIDGTTHQNIYAEYNWVGENPVFGLGGADGANIALGRCGIAGIALEKDANGNYVTEIANIGGSLVRVYKRSATPGNKGYATSLGFATAAAGIGSVAMGHYTIADGNYAFAGGSASMATNDNAFAFGRGVLAAGKNSFAFGEGWRRDTSEAPELIASGKNSVAMGDSTKASGDNSVALNESTRANGKSSFAAGYKSIADKFASFAAGDSSQALAGNSTALSGGIVAADAKNAAAIGKDASAQLADSVALGSKSIADRAGKVYGYDPLTGGTFEETATNSPEFKAWVDAYNEWETATTPEEKAEKLAACNAAGAEYHRVAMKWQSTENAVSVGNKDKNITRQIIGVAAGSEDTDAVNVAQLKALNQKVDDGAVHYYSVKSDQQGAGTNYANDGAKAADSMVIGISSSISEKAKNSTVLGNNNTLSNQPNARGVERDSENNSIVVGQNLTVEGARNAVFGTDYQNGTDKLLTHVAGERNTVIGVGNLVGYTAERVGTEWKYTKFKGHGDDENVVVGLTNTVNGGGVVVGTNTTVSAYGGVAFGHHNIVSGDEDKGVALGNDLNVSGYGALAVGTESTATGDYTIALGVESKAQALMAASMGYDSQAKASGSVALGAWSSAEAKQALALGYDSQAMVAGGVALGAKSVANRGKDVLGYDPVTGAAFANDAAVAAALGKTAELTAAETNIANAQTAVTAAQQAYDADRSDANRQALKDAKNTLNTAKSKKNELLASYKSVFGAVSVGRNDGTRQITNVAAGSEDTDAVNVAQLKALSGKVDEGAVHYFSVAADDSAKPENTNWNNDGATGAKAIAIGRGAKADGKHSIALGSDGAEFSAPKTTGEAAIAIGSGAEAGVQDISIGLGAKATGGFGVAIGRQSEAKASTAVAMAYGAKAEGANSLAIGILSDAKTADSAAYGREAKALGAVSLAVGMRSKAGADHTAVFGAEATTDATAWNGTAIGRSAYIGKQAPDGTTPNIGVSNNYFTPVDDDTVVAPGKETMNSTAVGFGAKAFGYQDTALGAGAEAFDTNTVSIGVMSKAIGHYANALGKQARAEGKDSVAIGHWARSIGESSMALGDYAITSTLDGTTSVTKSAAIGSHARAASDNSVALGANSLANIADDVATKAYLSNEAFAKGNGVVSVGNEEYKVGDTTVAKNYRRITNVAGGAADNDAVNVAQLKALSGKVDEGAVHYFSVNADDSAAPAGTNWNNDGAKSTGSIAVGQKAQTLELAIDSVKTPETISSDHAVALGSDASAAGKGSVAIGKNAVTGTRYATTPFGMVLTMNIAGDGAVAVGDSSQAATEGSVAVGRNAIAGRYEERLPEKKAYGIAIGDGAKAVGAAGQNTAGADKDDAGLAVGMQAYAAGNGTITMGYKAHAENTQNIIIGSNATTEALLLPSGSKTVHPISSIGIGADAVVKGRFSVAIGTGASVGNGQMNLSTGYGFLDFGGVALGYKSQVDRPGSVGLGSWTRPWRQGDQAAEQTKYAHNKNVIAPFSGQKLYFKDDIGSAQVYNTMGKNSVVNGVVSVGGVYKRSTGGGEIPFLRQIINVADGTEDTDAVNLRQLKAVNDKLDTTSTTAGTALQSWEAQIGGTKVKTVDKDHNTLNFVAGKNVSLTNDSENIKIATSDDVDFNKVTVGDTVINGNGLSITGGPAIAKDGIKAGDKNITNLAAGTADTDAVNVAQLKAVDKKVAVVFDDKKSLMSIDAKINHKILGDPGRFPEGEGQSIALGKGAYAYMQEGRKAQGVLFGMKKATGAIAIGENAKALSHSIAIGNRLYAGDMGDVKISPSDYNVENGSGVASTLLGNNSYAGGTLSTLVGSYSIMSTSYPGGHQKAYMQNAGAVSVGALNSIESATAKQGTSFFGQLPDDKSSGVANSIVGLANRAYNANGALIYGAGNEITNSIASVTAPAAKGSVKAAAENLRKAIKTNPGGAVLAIGGGNKADLAVRSQLIGVANTLTGTSETPSEYNMLDGFNNTGTNVKHITLMGSENTVSDTTGAILLGDKRKLTGANGSIVLGAADTEKELTVKDAVLIGHNADVQKAGGVALGAQSVASVDKGVAGYDPAAGDHANDTTGTWKATAAAVSVGKAATPTGAAGSSAITRQITNVAAGTQDTDAVNVAQLKAVKTKMDTEVEAARTHYYSVEDKGFHVANYDNKGAKGGMALAAGAGTVANGTASTATGAFNQIQGDGVNGFSRGFQGATSSVYGSFNTIAGKNGVRFDGVANSIVGVANSTENANAALVFGAGNKVTNSYRKVSAFDQDKAKEALQKAITTGDNTDMIGVLGGMVKESGGAVLALGGANTADYALLSKVVGVGNTLTGAEGKESKLNMIDGFGNIGKNINNVTMIGSKNTVQDTNGALVLGDNRQLTGADNSIILGSGVAVDPTGTTAPAPLVTNKKEVVIIGHNANSNYDNAVVLGSNSTATLKATAVTKAKVEGIEYSGFKGSVTGPGMQVSVGAAGKERQIKHVGAGEISKDSTDAINGSQLYAVASKMQEAATAAKTTVEAGDNVTVTAGSTPNSYKISAKDTTLKEGNSALKLSGKTLSMEIEDTSGKKVTGSVDLAAIAGEVDTNTTYTMTGTENTDNTTTISLEGSDGKKQSVTVATKDTRNTVKAGTNVTVDEAANADGSSTYTVNVKADGKVEAGNTGIVNGGTVYNETRVTKDGNYVKKDNTAGQNLSALDGQVKQNADNITNLGNTINNMGNQINNLDGRVNKVGAGAAALAAMHPLDFDPDDKWNVSAGYGSYKGSHAGAIGAFYRPDENTMFNIGASVGGGENMVNAGVTFALDRKSHITTSRTAMAREIMDLRKEITELKAARANGNWMLDPEMTKLFPDVPENHWAYEYIAKLAGNGIIKGYPDGSFAGNRMMTRYEFAALLYRAMENGANVDARALKEFAPEMGRIRVDRVYGKDNDRNKIERVRVNNENTQERDTYGSKIQIAAK